MDLRVSDESKSIFRNFKRSGIYICFDLGIDLRKKTNPNKLDKDAMSLFGPPIFSEHPVTIRCR